MTQKKVIVMDIDGTLCPIKQSGEHYIDLIPFPEILSRLREYREMGFYIILNTARNMRTHDGCIGLINKHTAIVMLEWLEKHDIPYDEIYYGKPWQGHGGFYVDDKTIRPEEFLKLSYDEILQIVEPNGNHD
jgi:capsule biosynthesis phosphatase